MKPYGLADEEIDAASADELRVAYRELLAENKDLRELISERTCGAIDELRKQDLKFNGNLPYGLEADATTKKLKPSSEEERMITEIKRLHAGGATLQGIARTLAEGSFINRKKGKVDAKQVARILDAAGIERNRQPRKQRKQ